VVLTNAVVYRVETDDKNHVQALHYFAPDKSSTRVTGKTFVLACNGIETPKILLLSKSDKNPNGVANRSDHVGRNMMDTPKMFVLAQFWNRLHSSSSENSVSANISLAVSLSRVIVLR
jgi:choline dehydrogenase-like flavoprotein